MAHSSDRAAWDAVLAAKESHDFSGSPSQTELNDMIQGLVLDNNPYALAESAISSQLDKAQATRTDTFVR